MLCTSKRKVSFKIVLKLARWSLTLTCISCTMTGSCRKLLRMTFSRIHILQDLECDFIIAQHLLFIVIIKITE